ncbi:MAG: hypothetical protein QM740_18475 [Acidovorax sp.]
MAIFIEIGIRDWFGNVDAVVRGSIPLRKKSADDRKEKSTYRVTAVSA